MQPFGPLVFVHSGFCDMAGCYMLAGGSGISCWDTAYHVQRLHSMSVLQRNVIALLVHRPDLCSLAVSDSELPLIVYQQSFMQLPAY